MEGSTISVRFALCNESTVDHMLVLIIRQICSSISARVEEADAVFDFSEARMLSEISELRARWIAMFGSSTRKLLPGAALDEFVNRKS